VSEGSVSLGSRGAANRELSVISETSSLLSGSVSSAAARAPLKVSKTVVRDRKIVFWTPVMIWPSGFIRTHKKETIEYRSDECLHNGKVPYMPVRMQGGVIIDLRTTEIESQIAQLLETSELVDDVDLCSFLDQKVRALKAGSPERNPPARENINVLDSFLFQSLTPD
jgi:hypothetical protein